MEVVILHKYGVKIFAIFLIIIKLPTTTICQDEVVQFYADDDNGYDQDYGPLIGEDDDENDFGFPKSVEAASDAQAKPSKPITREAMNCDENQLMTYLAKLQVTNPESLLLIASYKDLEHLCRRIAGNLDSIDSFLQTCTPLPQDHLYMQLIAGLRVLNANLCVESDYQKSYQKYLSCFHDLHTEYVDCAGPADWTENMDHNELCKEYKLIGDCYYTKTAMLCGIRAAETMKELVVRVVNGIIDTHCPELRRNPVVDNPMPESLSRATRCSIPNLNLDRSALDIADISRLLFAVGFLPLYIFEAITLVFV